MLLLLFIQSEERSIARTCRSALARDAPARRAGTSEQELSSACGSRVTFSLRGHARAGARANGEAGPKGGGQDARSKEKDNQRERPPRLALVGHRATSPALPQLEHPCPRLPGKSVSRGRAFRQHIHVLAKRHRHPCRCPLRGLSSPTHRRTGAPVEQRAILARTLQKSREQKHGTARGPVMFLYKSKALQSQLLGDCLRPLADITGRPWVELEPSAESC